MPFAPAIASARGAMARVEATVLPLAPMRPLARTASWAGTLELLVVLPIEGEGGCAPIELGRLDEGGASLYVGTLEGGVPGGLLSKARLPSRAATHDSGTVWLAGPFTVTDFHHLHPAGLGRCTGDWS